MVRDVFDTRAVSGLKGLMGIGHGELELKSRARLPWSAQTDSLDPASLAVRYPTAGSSAHAEAQPFYVNAPYGLVMAHVSSASTTLHFPLGPSPRFELAPLVHPSPD